MRLVCLDADTVDALKRLNIKFDDLTPNGLWSSQYHLVGLTADQVEALDLFNVKAEDVTPAQLVQGGTRQDATADRLAEPAVAAQPPTAPAADQASREPARGAGGGEAEVPLAQARDGGTAEAKADVKPDAKASAEPATQAAAAKGANPQGTAAQPGSQQKNAGGKGAGAAPPAQAGRKGQPAPGQAAPSGAGQRYGTTRLRISVAGKYTEATVANGKIVVGSRSFDSPDQAAAELTKSRGDWTFWEYYDSADGKWRMLTRDWDTVLKSAAPGGR
jgi:hypothetical protein